MTKAYLTAIMEVYGKTITCLGPTLRVLSVRTTSYAHTEVMRLVYEQGS